MSLIDALAQKGINFVEGIGKGVQFIGARAGIVPVHWPHETRPGLVWRIPEPEDIPATERVTAASIFAKKQPIVIREFEHAVVLENGRLYAELPSGVYDLSKAPIKGFLEIIWVSLSQSQHRWGVGGVMTVDGVTVGAFGALYVNIADATKFVLNLVAGQQAYTEDKIEAWMKNMIGGIMRRELATRDVRTLMTEREAFVEACKDKLAPMLAESGLEFKHIELVELNVPPEYRAAVQNVTLAGFNRQSAVLNAQTQAEITQIQAQADASARLMSGSADVQVMSLMQAHGLDPVKMETIKVLMEYAKSPSSGAGGGTLISGDLYKPQMFSMLSQVLMDPGIPSDVRQSIRQTFPQQSAIIPEPPPQIAAPPPAPTVDAPVTIEKVQQTLDNLDMQLAEGKLSEATYDRLKAKWEAKLQQLQGGHP